MKRKTKGYREPRRRGFDDDVEFPRDRRARQGRPPGGPPRESAPGPEVGATVKWFNPTKGFGFVELGDGSGDAFLHIATLQAAGHEAVQPGTTLRVQVGNGAKGAQVSAVHEVDHTTATPHDSRPPAKRNVDRQRHVPDLSTAVEMEGTVKWFNGDKGFGFVVIDDGGKDVFVHAAVLASAGLARLDEGQSVSIHVVDAPKGREAVKISITG